MADCLQEVSFEVSPIEVTFEVEDVEVDISPVGEKGDQGLPGEIEGATFSAICGETIHGERAVKIENGQIFHPQTSVAADALRVIGIATQSGVIGSTVQVRVAGQIIEGSWNWAPGFVFCDDAGVLVQPAPASGWLLSVAHVIDATTIEIDIYTPFLRS